MLKSSTSLERNVEANKAAILCSGGFMYLGIWYNIPEDEKGPWGMEQVKAVPSEGHLKP